MNRFSKVFAYLVTILICFVAQAQPGSLDLSFDPGLGTPTYVWATCVQPDGKILIGGNFTSYNGTSVNRIARLNSNGALDATFNLGGSGASSDVKAIQLQSDGKIILAGWFTTYNGISRRGVARLNADGSLDPSFDPGTGAGDCYSAAIQPDGKIIVGGMFSSYNGTPRSNIARINSNGTLDLTFLGCTGVDNAVLALDLQPDGKIIVGGQFTTAFVCAPSISVNRLLRLNVDGSFDNSFAPPSFNDNVYSIFCQGDGKIVVGGQFSGALRRLNSNGSTDIFPPSGSGPGPLGNSGIQSILQLPNGKYVISGGFSTYNGIARNNIAQLNADGTLDQTFNPGTGANQVIYTSSLQDDGRIIIGGNFTAYNGINRSRIARINAACPIITFNPFSDTTSLCGSNPILIAPGGYASYQWSTGATTPQISIVDGDKYSLTVTDQNGCIYKDSTLIDILNSGIINNDTVVCKGASVSIQTFASTRGFFYDIDGNKYSYINIGKQIWSRNNLTTTKYQNGTSIPNITSVTGWANSTSGAWSWFYNDSIIYSSTYGKMYNWFATVNSNGLAPSGWHVPSYPEWISLVNYLGGSSVAGGKLKKTGTSLWNSPNTGATNSTLFDGVPGSQRNYFGNFEPQIGNIGSYWSATENAPNGSFGFQLSLQNTTAAILFSGLGKPTGLSVRPISDRRISYLWSTGDTTETITVSPLITTTYYVNISNGITTCTDSVKVTISQVDSSIVALDPTGVCSSNGQVRLQAGLGSTYKWLRNNTVIPNATSRVYTATQVGSYRVIVTNSIGCSDTSRAIQVVINPQPTVSFTANSLNQCKNGNLFVFTNTSSISSGTMSYQWYVGDGTTYNTQNVTHAYQSAGTYLVKLVVTSNNGCSDSTTQTVTVYPNPTSSFTVNNLTQCLTGNSFIFTNTSTVSPGTLTYTWNFGNGNTSTAASPTVSFANAGTYTVTLVSTSNNGCTDTARQTVVVNTNPSGSIGTPSSTTICNGSSVTLTASGGTTYQWFLNGSPIPGATASSYNATLPGIYTVQINNASGCSGNSSNSVTLNLVSRPTADFSFNKFCAGFSTSFTNLSNISNSGVVSYGWNFGNGASSTNQNPTHIYTSPGTYNVTLTVTPLACPTLTATITKPISVVTAQPNVRYPSVNAIANRDLQLQARTFTPATYQWVPPTGLNNASIINPIFNSNRQQEYLIRITTNDGCVVTDTLLVRIFDGRGIYLPKGFTPNGDGNNDKLTPRLVGISRLLFFKVYDRWGQLMFQTSVAGQGWDGTFKGAKQPIETYTWVAEGIDIDGNTIRETGNSMLLR